MDENKSKMVKGSFDYKAPSLNSLSALEFG